MKLEQKKIILTGGSSGIGRSLLDALSSFKVQIVAADLYPDKITEIPGKLWTMGCDVSEPEHIDRLFEFAKEKMGQVDIFIANAGFAYFERIAKADWSHLERLYRTNLMSPIYSFEKMMEINQGREYLMVVVASLMAKLPLPGYAVYSSSKAALDAFFYSQQFERDDLGRVSLVFPVATRTNFFSTAADGTPVAWPTQNPEDVSNAIIKGIQKNRKYIYPSKISWFVRWANTTRIVFHGTVKLEQSKFNKWLEKKRES